LTDHHDIERVKQGDPEAFASLVNRYKAPAFSIALKILKNSEDAEEVVQEAFVRAFQNIKRFREESKFSTWLYRIVYNSCISEIRKNRRESVPLEKVAEHDPGFHDIDDALKQLSGKEAKAIVREALEFLNPADYTLLTLYYYEDKPLKEIGKVMGLKYGNVKVKIQRARGKLHETLTKVMKTEISDLL